MDAADAKAVAWVVKTRSWSLPARTNFIQRQSAPKGDVFNALYKANGSPTPKALNYFPDVKSKDSYYKAALWAVDKGLIEYGIFEGKYAYQRGYALYYVWQSIGAPKASQKSTFTDYKDWVFYADAVAWLSPRASSKTMVIINSDRTMPLRAWNLQNLFIMHTNKNLIKIVHVEKSVIRVVESTKRPPVDIITVINCTPKGRNEYMKNIIKKESLRTAICLMLVLAMIVTILPENVQAATSTPGFTLDLTDLASPMPLAAYGKATAGARFMDTSKISIPEGTTIYVADDRFTCSSMHIYRVFYNGRAFNMDSKYVADLKDTAAPDHYSSQDREKAEGSAVVGNITDPNHYFYIYAKPSEKVQNCRGAVAAGETIEIFKEKYNSKWAKILWHTPNGHNIFGYIQRKYINSADSYLAGAERSHQQAIKLAKKRNLL